jgi:nucleotide-binding universal stress UspA family protein
MKIDHILFPTDYSTAAQAALEKATDLARRHDATLHVVNVYEWLFIDGSMDGTAPMPVAPDLDAMRRSLAAIRPEGVKVMHELIFGLPANAIVRYALANDIDLIVLGTRSKSGWERLLVGSVTESVMRSAPCPVLTVHDESVVEMMPHATSVDPLRV